VSIPGSGSIHLRVAERIRYPHVLESFFYADDRMVRAIRRNKQRIFLDSGAYSAFTQGLRINAREYADFIRRNHDIIEFAANLDAIGHGNEELSYDRQKMLGQLLYHDDLSHLLKPVHHVRDHDDWLKRYLDDGHDFICLGGMVGESTRTLKRWLDHVWYNYLTHADGTPKVKVHGFGLTTNVLMFRYPWFSVDSTSWVRASRFGGVLMDIRGDDGVIRDYKINFWHDPKSDDWHYRNLRAADRMVVDRRLEELEAERIRHPEVEEDFETELGCKMGYNPEALGRCYGLRDIANIGYFHRAMDRQVDRFHATSLWPCTR
jgi:hypothetical protein